MPIKKNFYMRPTTHKSVMDHPSFENAEFSAENDVLPLKDQWAERWIVLAKGYKDVMDEVMDFEVRQDDVFVTTFMKCGTTWMQEAIWLLTHNLDFVAAKKDNISNRSPNIDGSGGVPRTPSTMEITAALQSPRVIKSHLPPQFLPKQIWTEKAKVIFVARNVKDCIVSNFKFFTGLMKETTFSMEDIAYDFMNDSLIYLPYLERVVDWWKMRDVPNVCFMTYEDMKRDLAGTLQRLCHFLERPELNEDELQKVVEHLTFDKMKHNKQAHIEDYCRNIDSLSPTDNFRFMRRGIIGSYKDEMPTELQRKVDDWSSKILGKHGLTEEDIFGKI